MSVIANANAKGGQATERFLQDKTLPSAIFFVYCYFMVDYFARFAARNSLYGQFRPTLVVFAILVVALFFQSHKVREHFKDPALKAGVVLLIYLFLSFPLVEWPGSVLRHHLDDFIRAFCFLFFTALIVDTDRRLKIFVFIFVILQLFRFLEPLYLNLTTGYMGGSTYIGQGDFAGRLSGSPADVINPNGLGFVIATCFAFSHFLFWRSGSKLLKILYLVLLPGMLYALVLTGSRGGFIAFVVVFLVVFLMSKHKLFLAVVAAVGVVWGWGQLDDLQRDRYLSLVGGGDVYQASADGRVDGMVNELRLGFNRPVVGHGLGTTQEAKVHAWGGRANAAHNLYAEVLIEIGIIGFLIFFWMLFEFYRKLRRNMKRFRALPKEEVERSLFHYRLNQALLAVFVMYAVYSINYFGLSQEYWYLFGGICIAFSRSLDRWWESLENNQSPKGASEGGHTA
ncbi:hypothetical protein HC341_16000 [Aquisalimonas sp. 2447]|uniref:O-antigen ligase family protein n=1 Tax=Aquisalimonas sp. 2447 TaxID=2740807 RepID=UPI0014325C01|nr:O-antigen ligase family protein [Aquisalimonas sp. 2447]QIT56563.1 hypothetical protein HC341_16000 [Aquisalimonas sp. 2447]